MTPKAQVPLVARLYDRGVMLVGFGVIIAVVIERATSAGAFDWLLLAAIPVLAVLARFPVILRQRHIGLEVGLDCAVLAFVAMSATRGDALVLWVLANVLVQMFASRNKSLDVRLFNTALSAGAGTAAVLAMWAVAPLGQTGPRETAAVLLGCAVYFIIDYVATAVSIALDCRDRIYRVLFTRALPLSFVGFLGVVSLGWLAAICLRYAPYGLPLVAIPFITVIAAMRTVANSNRERARLQVLFDTSLAGHAAVTAGDVEEVLLSRAVALLRCHSVQLVATPPDESAGEIGAHVSSGADGAADKSQWLVASRRLTERPYDEVDRESLSTLAGVGAESLRRAELAAAMTRMARHDALTGLVNRSVLHEQFGQAIAHAGERPTSIGVIYLDLDGFKTVNDTLGHEAGDELLLQVAHRLRAGVRTADTVARMGGDEFAVLVESVGAVDSVRATAHRLLVALSEPFSIRGVRVIIGASVGYALRDETENVSELLQRADLAMYTVKERGKHGVAAFTPDMLHRHSARARLLQELREALVNDELRVHLQPVILLDSGRIDGVEALVRWQHPTRGLLGPADFIDVAEESGLIEELGLWVLRAGWRDAERLGRSLGRPVTLAVNVASSQLGGQSLVAAVASLPTGGCFPTLVLEVTERDLVDDADSTATLLSLRSLGVSIAVDDFGTGYSSFAYLRTLPVDIVKLDRQFIVDAVDDPRAIGVIRGVTAMAQALELVTVAEGVETQEQADLVAAAGCQLAQGYLFARPMPVDALIAQFTVAAA